MINSSIGNINFSAEQNVRNTQAKTNATSISFSKADSLENDIFDCFVFQDEVPNIKKVIQDTKTPKIGTLRVLTHRFTKEQINAVNESRELPKNAKFTGNNKISIKWNLLDVTKGTHKLPAGYELKNDILGYTHVVREGTKSLFIR